MTQPTPDSDEVEALEQAFYRAFENSDLSAMMALWDDSDDIVCIHPMGPPLQGRAAVEASWREILSGGANMRFTIEPLQHFPQDQRALRIVIEHITVAGGKRVAPMVSTNLYRQTAHGWRMCLHHASPAPERGHHAPDSGATMH